MGLDLVGQDPGSFPPTRRCSFDPLMFNVAAGRHRSAWAWDCWGFSLGGALWMSGMVV